MELKISAKNIDLNLDSEKYAQKKFKRLERHLRSLSEATLEVARTSARSPGERIVAQMTVTANGYTLRGQERAPDLYTAIDAVTDVLDGQIRRHKGKVYRTAQAKKAARVRPAEAPVEVIAEGPAVETSPELGNLVRTKRFRMTPMTVEDAITEMDLLSHDFFLFYNIDSDEYNVVYRRHDGDYGVIEPSLD